MEETVPSPEQRGQSDHLALSRLCWVGPLVIAAAMVTNAVVRTVALSLFDISSAFHQLMWGHLLSTTVLAVSGAVIVFGVVARYAQRPVYLYWRIAGVVLVISFLPDVAMLAEGQSLAAVGTLMMMHVVDAAICVGGLPVLTRTEGS